MPYENLPDLARLAAAGLGALQQAMRKDKGNRSEPLDPQAVLEKRMRMSDTLLAIGDVLGPRTELRAQVKYLKSAQEDMDALIEDEECPLVLRNARIVHFHALTQGLLRALGGDPAKISKQDRRKIEDEVSKWAIQWEAIFEIDRLIQDAEIEAAKMITDETLDHTSARDIVLRSLEKWEGGEQESLVQEKVLEMRKRLTDKGISADYDPLRKAFDNAIKAKKDFWSGEAIGKVVELVQAGKEKAKDAPKDKDRPKTELHEDWTKEAMKAFKPDDNLAWAREKFALLKKVAERVLSPQQAAYFWKRTESAFSKVLNDGERAKLTEAELRKAHEKVVSWFDSLTPENDPIWSLPPDKIREYLVDFVRVVEISIAFREVVISRLEAQHGIGNLNFFHDVIITGDEDSLREAEKMLQGLVTFAEEQSKPGNKNFAQFVDQRLRENGFHFTEEEKKQGLHKTLVQEATEDLLKKLRRYLKIMKARPRRV